MRSRRLRAVHRGLAVLTLILLVACQAILTAPEGAVMTLVVNPEFVEAHGGVAVVSALLVEAGIGTVVADGTVVQFFTNLGTIQEQGKTNDGVARVNFVSDSRSGTATVTAVSGLTTAEKTIQVGGARPVRVAVSAVPQRLTDSRTSQITATVFDASGNPVPNIGVIFRVDGDATDFMESNGLPVFTDADGRARDVYRTRYPFGAAPKVVTVIATTTATPGTGGASPAPGSTGGEVQVFVN